MIGTILSNLLISKRMNALLLVILTILLRFLIKYWRSKKALWAQFETIPGPPTLPIIGNVLELYVDHAELFRRFMAMRRLWGAHEGINKAWFGQRPYVFLSKASTVESLLGNNRNLDKSSDYRFLRPWLGTGLLTSHGAKWQRRRKILTPSFHFRILEDFVQVFAEQTDTLVRKLTPQAGSGQCFDLFPYVTLCTLDIICETAMGRKVEAQNHSGSVYVRAIYDIGKIIQARQATLWLQPDCLFRWTSLYRKHENCLRILHGFSRKVISERKRAIRGLRRDSESGGTGRLAFLDLLIEASQNGLSLSDDDIREEVDTFMFEGHDTTSSAVSFTLFLLGCYPDVQEKVFQELTEIFNEGDKNRHPSLQDLRNMRYLEMCIKESLRLYPSVPLLARKVSEDVKIGDFLVPEGTTALIILPMLHRDPEVFSYPEKFDPERFLPELSVGRHPFAYIPFSAGPRNCIGQKFAMLEEKAIISGILRKFRIEAVQHRDDICLTAELVLRVKNGLRVRISERNSE